MSLKFWSVPFFLIIQLFLGPLVWAEEIAIHFKTTPPVQSVRPVEQLVTFSLLVTTANGRPVESGSVRLRLAAPPSGGWFSTDFPMVEGRVLADLTLPLKRGRTEFKSTVPIRGLYTLNVDFADVGGIRAARTFNFNVRENLYKWVWLLSFVLGLFATGVIAGRIFTNPSRVAAQFVLFLITVFTFPRTLVEARPTGELRVGSATVGKLTEIAWRLHDDGHPSSQSASLTLAIEHIEKDKKVFALEIIPVAGEYKLKFHFADGAEYRVAAVAMLTDGQKVESEQKITVTGVEPPTSASLPAVLSFVAVIAFGLIVGRWSRFHRTKNPS